MRIWKFHNSVNLLKYNLLLIFVIFSLPSKGQLSSRNDTIRIKEVVISRKRFNPGMPGFKRIIIDSAVMVNYSNKSLAEVLTDNSPLFLKSYGSGGIATPSFRGTGATHTQITWNGININHPMLGQSDFSLIPSGMIDKIEICPGNASMEFNSGGFGGIVNLNTSPDWKKQTVVTLSPELGSFGRFAGFSRVKTGNDHFQTVTKVYLHSAENDFRFLNTVSSSYPLWEIRKNSQVHQKGLMQEFYLKGAKSILSARLWYQSASRNLPAPIITRQVNMGEKQDDEALRILLSFDSFNRKINYFLTTAGIMTRLNYSNHLASVSSENLTRSVIIKGGLETRIGEFTRVKVILNNDLHLVNSNNYEENAIRNTVTATVSAERNSGSRFGTLLLLREIIDGRNILIPDFSSGFELRLLPEKNYFLRGNIAKNSKIPTMNDMYWAPGGNPDLKNEYAFSYELTYSMDQKISKSSDFKQGITFFKNSIRNMIQWHPGDYSYWIAENIESVNTSGVESSLSVEYAGRNFNLLLNAGYSYTRAISGKTENSTNLNQRKQLIYVPGNLANATINLDLRNYYVLFVTNFAGRRYITVDNSDYLPGYSVNNLTTGVRIHYNNLAFDLNFKIDNIFNADYQTVAYYPQPGRSYLIRIMLQFVK
jgi:outer membrane cobalamin receptor